MQQTRVTNSTPNRYAFTQASTKLLGVFLLELRMKIPSDMISGVVHKTRFCGDLEIVEYSGAHNVKARFKSTATTKTVSAHQIRSGKVKDHNFPTSKGVGFIGIGKYNAIENKKHYGLWRGVMERGLSESFKAKNPTYKGCTVHPDWHNFQNFAKWYEENHPNDGGKWELDKDILTVGNKIYSPDTCLFLPHWINSFTISCNSSRGDFPVGAYFDKDTGMFRAKCSKDGKTVNIGRFSNPEDAHLAWRKYKLKLALDKKSEMDDIDLRIYPNIVRIINEAR